MAEKPKTIADVVAEAGKPFRDDVATRAAAKKERETAEATAVEKKKHDDEVAAAVHDAKVKVEAQQKLEAENAEARALLEANGVKVDVTVAEPAAKSLAFAFKANEELGVIEGIASVADIFDRENERVQKGALIDMAFSFCAKAKRQFKLNHEKNIPCDLVESFTGAPTKVPGVIDHTVKSHWFVTLRPHDAEILEAAKAGKIIGMSWGGGKEVKDAA